MATSNNSATNSGDTQSKVENVSLGPACGVLFIVVALIIAVAFTVGAYLLLNKQGTMAASAIREQLVPWVESSTLLAPDRERIVTRLNELSFDIEQERVNDRQLMRLHTRLHNNPVLQWGPIDQTLAFANSDPSFTQPERDQLQAVSDRLLLACSQFQVNVDDLGFILQKLALRDDNSGALVLRETIEHSDVISFMRRAEEMLDKRRVPKDGKLEKSVSQVFDQMIDDALNEDKKIPTSG